MERGAAPIETYREAVHYLRMHPTRAAADRAYLEPGSPGSALFRFCTPDGAACTLDAANGIQAGDPLMVKRSKEYQAWSWDATSRIRAMRLPDSHRDLGDAHLVLLARLQRELDETIRCEGWRREHVELCDWPWWADAWDERNRMDDEGSYGAGA